ncbi:XRE family transcriptional regulator [Actinomadura craniellae]|uniref:XRE family transcriptional regulator n=1 Tax=Actinomadura craniellae TaxID=2231787 RepID=A0A365GX58_9ACTN|nr:helix-turn-helix transcriptional regulator [Actinomadura craniellae]RAY11417.1 XRE family transcriptional regulator [Actinomadura craniellae]
MSTIRRTWLEYFAKELIAWREFRGMTQEKLATAITFSPSLVAMVETCQRTPRPEFIERCDEALQTGGALMRFYKELVSRESIPDYLDRWRGVEEQATVINTFQLEVVPGLLQTPDYARVVLQTGLPTATPEEIEAKVAARLERQAPLTSDRPPMFVAILDEGAIRRVIGGSSVMREQLMHLVKLCERPHIVVQVVRAEVGAYAGIGGPFNLATLDGDEVAYLDTTLSGHVVENPEEVAIIKHRWESLRAEALPRPASLRLIKEVADQWTP